MLIFEFDVAKTRAALPVNGARDISRPQWSRVVVSIEAVWRSPVTVAHLRAAQFAGARGMVVAVLLRE